ncbi:unnamed protein product [Spirodela intermedia]|uniref:Uncharacterized protein n=2 Tax=Spirodela intermedia TaxID=51605 RepID=A0A7I8IUW9_SPIIN|nr:unnamed protein product [Spirodela intermedia]CAA6660781.1 unnamed protein product [Spirodela intermedia]CAA7397133.1 unnamed protein product [Spirodela intermedia]
MHLGTLVVHVLKGTAALSCRQAPLPPCQEAYVASSHHAVLCMC